MFELIKNIFRKRALRKNASTVPTRIEPLTTIRTAVTVIDVEDTSFDKCKESILAFYRDNHIKGEIFFFDFRKIGNEERLITSIVNTVLKRDINWFGKLSREKMALLESMEPDLFISLIKGTDFPIEYMSKCCRAKFKIGRTQLAGGVFDLVVSEPKEKDCHEAEVFEEIKKYIKIITDK